MKDKKDERPLATSQGMPVDNDLRTTHDITRYTKAKIFNNSHDERSEQYE